MLIKTTQNLRWLREKKLYTFKAETNRTKPVVS